MQGDSTNRQIRVLLADDHTMFREGLAAMLVSYGSIEVVGKSANDEGALKLAQEQKPDVVIMQVQMPFERAKESLLKVREISPPPKVIIVTMFEEPRYVRELIDLGASAYVVKSSSVDHLLGAVRAAVFDPTGKPVVVGMPRQILEEAEEGLRGVLSARQLEILLLAARGLSDREIASRIHIAEGTVKRHLANVYSKMRVASRGEAMRKALSEGWITISDITHDGEEGWEGPATGPT